MTDPTPRPDDEILQEALERAPEERNAFLRDACAGDESRIAGLRALLDAHERAGTFLDELPAIETTDTWIGERVGPFEIVGRIGEGGSGRVYEARRVTGDFEQTVAIKLLRRSIDAAEDIRRFRTECEALARLDHPNVAHLIDGGLLDGTHPYLVIERIEGRTLYEYCDEERLDLAARLRLFLDVCVAVEYAHQNLVVHRDLKPGNILVTEDGRVKLLDFGIAKLLAPEGESGDAGRTLTTQIRLTPRYASPEQLVGGSISTLSDVYSLGIVLYELITGNPPYRLEGHSSAEWRSVLDSTTITDPSGAVDEEASRAQGQALAALRRRLRGDLDNVVLKALHREPDRRYGSPAALAEDIERHLSGLPVKARPDTAGYRFSKFVRRNPLAVTAAGVALLALVGATVVSTLAFFDVRESRRESELERQTAERVVEFLENMIASANPEAMQSSDELTVVELLEGSGERIEVELADKPRVAARLHDTLGRAYRGLEKWEQADRSLNRARELRSQNLGLRDPDTIESWTNYAAFRANQGDLDGALAQVDSLLGELQGANPQLRLGPLALRSDLQAQRGDFEAAIAAGEEALPLARELGDDPRLLEILNNVGLAYTRSGRPTESVATFREAIEVSRRQLGPTHSRTGQVLQNLGFALGNAGRPEDSIAPLQEALEIYEAVFDSNHTRIAAARSNLGNILGSLERFDEAETHHHAAIEIFRRSLGPEHVNFGHTTHNLGTMYMLAGNYEPAIARIEEAVRVYENALGLEHPNVAAALYNKARCQRGAGQLDAALQTSARALELREKILDDDHPDIARSSELMGRLMMDFEKPAEARPWFERSAEIRREVYAEDNMMRIDAERELGLCLQALGEYETAASHLEVARDALVAHRGPEDEKTQDCEAELAALYEEWGREPDSE